MDSSQPKPAFGPIPCAPRRIDSGGLPAEPSESKPHVSSRIQGLVTFRSSPTPRTPLDPSSCGCRSGRPSRFRPSVSAIEAPPIRPSILARTLRYPSTGPSYARAVHLQSRAPRLRHLRAGSAWVGMSLWERLESRTADSGTVDIGMEWDGRAGGCTGSCSKEDVGGSRWTRAGGDSSGWFRRGSFDSTPFDVSRRLSLDGWCSSTSSSARRSREGCSTYSYRCLTITTNDYERVRVRVRVGYTGGEESMGGDDGWGGRRAGIGRGGVVHGVEVVGRCG
ncbi:hypothetical protein DFP72DRAFT_146798 [Ephemerocybe angulata]|uniref:Uncharacterized protein n=1 Tax=Ephemerocybe angulata TaxID=980116 RepID=A0A8H6LVW6_9AGAR|nr:hypothetical protein DFP72DRAFT_146798 [Tulosesus angulatus]